MPDPLVLYEVDEKVGIVTLNRPEKLNAISAELQEQLTDAFARADADPRTSVVLLRAEDRSFCAGYDISAKDDWRGDPTRAHEHLRVQLDFEMVPWLRKKPVIGSVQGSSYAEAMVTGEEVSPKPPKGARSDAPLV
jgi:enoyl-CoA hydratase/carnithine racemase